MREFKHLKVVRPEWLVESIQAGELLPWQNYIFRPGERVEDTQGRKIGQKSLFNGFVSQAARTHTQLSPSKPPSPRKDSPIPVDEDASTPEQPEAGPSIMQPAVAPHTPKKQKRRQTLLSPRKSAPSTPIRSFYTTDPATPDETSRIPGYAADKSNPHAERAMANPAWRAAHTSVAPDFIEGYYKNSRLHHLSTWKSELKNLVAEAQERAENAGAETWTKMAREEHGGHDGTQVSATQIAVDHVVQENLGGRGLGSAGLEGDVSMRGAKLVRRLPGLAKGKGKGKAADDERVIMHCDFDSFFVSAGLVDRPHLRGKPVVVCHSQGATGGASSTSEIASASYEARKFGIKGGMRYVPF